MRTLERSLKSSFPPRFLLPLQWLWLIKRSRHCWRRPLTCFSPLSLALLRGVQIRFHPPIHLCLSFILGDSVSLLYPPDQLIALAVDDVNIIVCQLAPSFLHQTFCLLPIALKSIGVHGFLLA